MIEPYEMTWLDERPVPDPPASPWRIAIVAAGVLLLGAPAGLLWAALSPSFAVTVAAGGPTVDDFDDGVFFQVDGTFLLVVAIAGVLSGLAAWLVGRRHGPAIAVALAASGLAAARVAQAVGERVVVDGRLARFCGRTADTGLCALYDGTHELRSGGLVVGWALVALVTFSVLTLATDRG